MSKPKKKQTKTCKRNRRAHFSIDTKTLTTCEKCNAKVLPHRACVKCGNYKGRSVLQKVYDRVVSNKAEVAVQSKDEAKAEIKEAVKAEVKAKAPKAAKKVTVKKEDAEKKA